MHSIRKYGNEYPILEDVLLNHHNDPIGHVFSINNVGFKVINKQKSSTTFKKLSSGENIIVIN